MRWAGQKKIIRKRELMDEVTFEPRLRLLNKGGADWEDGTMVAWAIRKRRHNRRAAANGEVEAKWPIELPWYATDGRDRYGRSLRGLHFGLQPEIVEKAKHLRPDESPPKESEFRAVLSLPSGEEVDFEVESGIAHPIGHDEPYWVLFHLKHHGANKKFLFHISPKRAKAHRIWLLNPRGWSARRRVRLLTCTPNRVGQGIGVQSRCRPLPNEAKP